MMLLKKLYYIVFTLLIHAVGLAQDVRIIEQQPERLRLQVITDTPVIHKLVKNDSIRSQINSAEPLFQQHNGYMLPYKPIILNMNNPRATVRLLSVQEHRIPMPPPLRYSEMPVGVDSARVSESDRQLFKPQLHDELVTVDYLGHFKQNQLLRAAVYPYRYDERSHELIVYSNIVFDVSVTPADAGQQPIPAKEIEFLENLAVISTVSSQKSRRSPLTKNAVDQPERWKIIVNKDGIYRITGHDLAEAGVSLLAIDFKKLRLTSNGRDVSIYADGWRDGQFDVDDYFEFWGTANKQTFQDDAPDLYQDPHSENHIYWLSWESRGLWMVEESGEISDTRPGQTIRPYSYLETVHVEENNYYDHLSSVELDTLRDHWFYDRGIIAGKKVDYRFNLWHPDTQSPLSATARAMLSGSTTIVGSAHNVSIYLNNSFIASHEWYMQDIADLQSEEDSFISGAELHHGENILSVVNNVNPQQVDNVLLNWFQVSYPRLYRAQDDFIKFKIPPNQDVGNYLFRIDGFVDPDIHVYKLHQSKIVGGLVEEVTDFQDYTSLQMSFQNDVFYPETEFVAVSTNAKLKPLKIEQDEPSLYRSNQVAANYIIITHAKFFSAPAFDQLIQLRQSQGYQVLKVNVQDIYDEFSHGHVSSYAIRDFIKWAYEQWPEPRLQHVFLVGDGCYTQTSATGDTLDYIPVHMRQTMSYGSAASDFWYSLISGNDEIPDINIGRLPIQSVEELDIMISKIVNYETSAPGGDWPNRFLIIGGNGATFRSQGIALSKIIPPQFETRLLFSLKDKSLDNDPYFGSTSDLLDYIDLGCSFITFHGHGGGAIWADNNLLRLEDVSRFYTQGKLPFILSMTCYTGAFEDPNREQSLADALLFTEGDGAIAMLGASGVGWEWNDYFLQTEIVKQFKSNTGSTLGDMITAGKIAYLAHYKTSQAISQVNQYHLLGDPATRIRLPERQVTLHVDNPILLKGESVNASTVLGFQQGFGSFSVEDSVKKTVSQNPVTFSNGTASATLEIDENFAGESGLVRFYGSDDFGNNRSHGSIAISLKGAVFDSAYVSPTPDDSLYFFTHIRSRSPLQHVWCLTLNDSLTLSPVGNDWYKTTRAVKVAWTGFQFSYYFYALDENGNVHASPLYKHYINFDVDVAIDQQDIVFTGRDLVYLEATIHNTNSNDVTRMPVCYEYKNQDESWQIIGHDTVDIDAFASIKSSYHYAPAPGPLTLRITLDPDSTMREKNRDNNVLVKTLSPSIFQCTSTGFLLNGHKTTSLRFDDRMSLELPIGALAANSAILIDTLEEVKIIQQPAYTYIAGTPAYNVQLLAPTADLDKAATFILSINADSISNDSTVTASHLFRFSRQTKKWIKCDTQKEPDKLYAELPDIGPVALLNAVDLTPPQVSIAIDGQPYVPGKWASREPRIGIRLQDANGVDISTDHLEIIMNGKTVDETELALPDSIIDGNQILISYNPQLLPGDQLLSVRAADCNRNYSERFEFMFRVANQFDIHMLGNYPNPFEQETRFIYIFTSPVDDMSLKLFTASGRLIRQFDSSSVFDDPNPLSADYHEIYWDGTDAEGFEVANGVYFYRLAARSDNTTKTVTGKIAKIQ
ncbi:hypothetical protein EH223_02865 [candidate division KSB1 bacterium]|nr:hypothetical protein [candidate division KSB1 bacterium]RQW06082.1 MAG: hypothetical protein EH223_02865 [candidate division KSB1 bacterium]